MAHDHGHSHTTSVKLLRTAFLLNATFTVIELVGSTLTGSVAVLADAVHDLGDCLVLGAAWYLQHISIRGRDEHYTFGYARFSMLGGWLAAMVLIAGAIWTVSMAVPRMFDPRMPHTTGMIGLALLGLVANGFAAWSLHRGHSLNEKGVFLHLMEDLLGWAAVLVGAMVMHLTDLAWIDPALSIAIAVFILFNAIGTLRRGTRILMLRKPGDLDLDALTERICCARCIVKRQMNHFGDRRQKLARIFALDFVRRSIADAASITRRSRQDARKCQRIVYRSFFCARSQSSACSSVD